MCDIISETKNVYLSVDRVYQFLSKMKGVILRKFISIFKSAIVLINKQMIKD